MNKLQQAELKRAKRILAFFEEHPEFTEKSPLLKLVRDAVADLVTMLDANALIQINDLTGMTKSKDNAKSVVMRQLWQIGGILEGYFSLYNMPTAEAQAHTAATYLTERGETELNNLVVMLYNLAQQVKTDLPKMNLTTEQIELLQTHGKTFDDMVSGRQLSEKERTSATASIDRLLNEIKHKLSKQADKLMRAFAESDPELFEQYESLRRVERPYRRKKATDEPTETAAITFKFVDNTTFAPVEGVTVEENGTVLTETSDEDGELYREEVSAGVIGYRFIGPAHKAKTFSTPELEAGQEYNYEIELQAEA
jgi:hypothetical protein